MAKRLAKVVLNSKEDTMKVNSSKMRSVDTVNITGLMVNNMKVNGAITKCTAKERLSGKTRRNIKELSSMTREKAAEPLVGLMADNMLANGEPENNTVREHILVLRDRESQVSGRTVKRLNGLKLTKHNDEISIMNKKLRIIFEGDFCRS